MTDELTCRRVLDLLTEYLEGVLSPRAHAAVAEHLHACDVCVRYLDQLRTTVAVVGSLHEDEVPPEVRASLVSAFRAWHRRDV